MRMAPMTSRFLDACRRRTTDVRPVWFKCAVIAMPFVGILVDVSSWYMIKIYHPFAWVEILAGMVLAACFAFMWVVTLYQMWFSKPPKAVLERMGGDIPI